MSARLSEIQSGIADARHSRGLAASEIQECETALSTLDPRVPEHRGLIAFWDGKLAEERAAKSREQRALDDLVFEQAAELSRLQSIGRLRAPQPV